MPRNRLCVAIIFAFAFPCSADETTSTPETLIRLRVSPTHAPKPALRYRLGCSPFFGPLEMGVR